MTNNQSRMYESRFRIKYKSKRLSLSTRLEILKKRHLIKKARRLLQQGIETPSPASLQDDCEDVISIEVLAQILEDTRNYQTNINEELKRKHSLIDNQTTQPELIFSECNNKVAQDEKDEDNTDDNIKNNSDTEINNYDSDNFEVESEEEDDIAERKCLVGESPVMVEI